MTREQQITAGKIWQVYPDNDADNVLFEGGKTKCLAFIKQTFGIRQYNEGKIRLGKVIWEK